MTIIFGLLLILDGLFTGFSVTKVAIIYLYAIWTGASKWIK